MPGWATCDAPSTQSICSWLWGLAGCQPCASLVLLWGFGYYFILPFKRRHLGLGSIGRSLITNLCSIVRAIWCSCRSRGAWLARGPSLANSDAFVPSWAIFSYAVLSDRRDQTANYQACERSCSYYWRLDERLYFSKVSVLPRQSLHRRYYDFWSYWFRCFGS